MILVKKVQANEGSLIDDIVSIHINTFQGFFLTFMGKGFLKQMYLSYSEYSKAGILVAIDDKNRVQGFLAYSSDFSGLYKYMIKTKIVLFAWYSVGAFFRKPSSFMHIIKAFVKPSEAKRNEEYVELASIGVDPRSKSKGIGSKLIDELKKQVDFEKYAYITLETDAIDNDAAINFYEKNGFIRKRQYKTSEDRVMFEYIYKE